MAPNSSPNRTISPRASVVPRRPRLRGARQGPQQGTRGVPARAGASCIRHYVPALAVGRLLYPSAAVGQRVGAALAVPRAVLASDAIVCYHVPMSRVVLVGLFAVGCRSDAQPPPARSTPVNAPPPVVSASADDSKDPPPIRLWLVHRLSADGKRALQYELSDGHATRYRVVAVDTNAIESDLALPVMSTLPLQTLGDERPAVKLDVDRAELRDEVLEVAALVRGFPLGSGHRIAATPDGGYAAFNGGDWLFTAQADRAVEQVADEASYNPWFTPDGKTLLFHRENGLVDGVVGKYEVFATSSDGREQPRRIAGTAGVHGHFALSPKSGVRVIVSSEPQIKTCVVEIALAKPNRAKRLGCLPGGERVVHCVLSPSGARVACDTVKVLAPDKRVFRARAMEVETGKIEIDRAGDGHGVSAISDDGLLVLRGPTELVTVDARGREKVLAARAVLFTQFRSATELVIEGSGRFRVVDVTK